MISSFNIPTEILFGCDKFDDVGNHLKDMKVNKVMLVCDETMVKLGFIERLLAQFTKNDIRYIVFDKVMPNPTDELVKVGAKVASEAFVDSFVAIGGGSVMDFAKAINIVLNNGGVIGDYEGVNLVKHQLSPSILIPTTSGTASELTSVSVITDTFKHKKMVIAGRNVGATIAICDPMLTMELPKGITASTGMDALTHALEAYVSKCASPITDVLALKAIELINRNLEDAVMDSNKQNRYNMMLGSSLAGMAFNTALLGFVHSLAHPLSAHYDIPHGIANAIFLPFVVEYNIESFGEKTAMIAEALNLKTDNLNLFEVEKLIIDRLHDLSRNIGIPSFKSLNIQVEQFEIIGELAMNEMSTLTNPKTINEIEAIGIIEKAYNYEAG